MSCFLIPTGVMYCTIILSKDKKKMWSFSSLVSPSTQENNSETCTCTESEEHV